MQRGGEIWGDMPRLEYRGGGHLGAEAQVEGLELGASGGELDDAVIGDGGAHPCDKGTTRVWSRSGDTALGESQQEAERGGYSSEGWDDK